MPTDRTPSTRDLAVDSPAHPFVKHLVSLQHRKYRSRSYSFFAEGLQAAILAVESAFEIRQVVYCPELLHSDLAQSFLARCRDGHLPMVRFSERAFSRVSRFDRPSGIGLLLGQRFHTLQDLNSPGPLWLLALEEIQYAGNLGTILRTCDAIGMHGVVLLSGGVDPYSPEVVTASMGSVFTQRLVRTTPDRLLAFCHTHGIEPIAATPRAGAATVSRPDRFVLVMGSERHGLSEDLRTRIHLHVSLPMRGRLDSLNVAVAAGILLYQLTGQP